MYYMPQTGAVLANHSAIRAALPHVIFFSEIADEDLAYHGVFVVKPAPPALEEGQIADPLPPVEIDGEWTEAWSVRAKTPEEVEAGKPQVPQRVTRRQARQALLLNGLLEQVPVAIAAIEDPMQRGLAQIEWEDSLEFERQRPLVISIGAAMGLDLDSLFIQAGAL